MDKGKNSNINMSRNIGSISSANTLTSTMFSASNAIKFPNDEEALMQIRDQKMNEMIKKEIKQEDVRWN